MPNSDATPVYSALNEVLALWRSDQADSIARTDIERLERIVESDTLHELWAVVSERGPDLVTEVATKMLLQELFEATEGIPEWEEKSGTQRRRRLEQIGRAAQKLADLLADTPIRYLSEEAINEMGLAAPPLAAHSGIRRVGDPDFGIALEDLREQVTIRIEEEPILRRKSGEDTHRAYFIIRIARYLRRSFGIRSNKLTAELTRIMLRDDEIDAETVRKTRGIDSEG